jgi:protein-arginine kinase activator protein McsA
MLNKIETINRLLLLKQEKNEVIRLQKYEMAAKLRDEEKILIRNICDECGYEFPSSYKKEYDFLLKLVTDNYDIDIEAARIGLESNDFKVFFRNLRLNKFFNE